MTIGSTQLLVCQRALADIGTRSTITSVNPPDGSQEAFYCKLYYDGIRDHILRAANWSFAKTSTLLTLWKALPGTPENPTPATISGWSDAYPAPPWTYSYMDPGDCLRARAIIGQPQQVPISPPIFSGSQGTNPPISQRLPMARFEIANDYFDRLGQQVLFTYGIGPVSTIVNAGSGYHLGDRVVLSDNGGAGISGEIVISGVSAGGAVTSTQTELAGTYTNAPTDPLSQVSTSGVGTGLVVTMNYALNSAPQTVILTNQEFPILEYTTNSTYEPRWDAMFEEAVIAALAARLAQVLTGDKALANAKYSLANTHIINARAIDGNEGLTINDHIPDWIRVRGAGGGLGYEAFFYPLGPLFPVAPLV
jgi:hypothetical protein